MGGATMRLFGFGATIAATSVLLVSCATEPQWVLTEGQHKQTFSGEVRRPIDGQFLLYLPNGFSRHPAEKYPLLIYLHGSGEAGIDIDALKKHAPPKFLDDRPDFPFIVVSPQAPYPPRGFDPEELTVLLDQVMQRLPIDKNRVYLTGFSMGAYGTYRWASVHPETFAAIAPVSGAARPQESCSLRSVPIWAFHGAKDESVKVGDDEAGVNAIKACGGDVKITVYPDGGHSSDAAYADPQLYQWFLEHRRSDASAKQILADRAAREKRIKDQIPAANAESTLRRLVSDFASGTPDYSQMTSTLATRSRRLAEKAQAKLMAFGTLNALRYKGTEKDGSDVYEAEFAKGRAQFRLLFQEDGKIAGVSFDPVP
jgi:poly(3-hydroxybutyrate) depolymerase